MKCGTPVYFENGIFYIQDAQGNCFAINSISGPPGRNGGRGRAGSDGAPGAPGAQGPQGPPGPGSAPQIYKAIITSNGFAPPTVIVLENTLGQTIAWTSDSITTITGTPSTTPFDPEKTLSYGKGNWDTGGVAQGQGQVTMGVDSGTGDFKLTGNNLQSGTPNVDAIVNQTVIIEVYP